MRNFAPSSSSANGLSCILYTPEPVGPLPRRRMRRLRAMVPERCDGLASVPSWSRLMAAYFLDGRFGVAQYTGVSTDYLEALLDESLTETRRRFDGSQSRGR